MSKREGGREGRTEGGEEIVDGFQARGKGGREEGWKLRMDFEQERGKEGG